MAGHSKWANIQHRKGRQDARRSRLFSRLIREISVAARQGGPNPEGNPRLRAAIDAANSNNLPKDSIERALNRGGDGAEKALAEDRYEGYGPGGAAVIVDCLTNNRNRAVSEIRYAFKKCGGALGTEGSVSHLFRRLGILRYPPGTDEEALFEAAAEAGAEEVKTAADGIIEVWTAPDSLYEAAGVLEAAGHRPQYSRVELRARETVALEGERAAAVRRLLDMLEELEDVQQVHCNASVSGAGANEDAA